MKPNRRDLLRASGSLAMGSALGGLNSAAAGAVAADDIRADEVQRSIEHGIRYLKYQQLKNGAWPEMPFYAGGLTPLCTLALLNAGCGLDDEAVSRALEFLRGLKPLSTYTASLQTMAFCAGDSQRDLPLILRNVKWLESQQVKDGDSVGMWGDPLEGSPDHIDNSMTHFAMLGLYEAERAGVTVNAGVWQLALRYWQRSQNADGSWGWGPTYDGTGSMTCAGIAALVIASDQLNVGDARADGDRVQCCCDQQSNAHLERALAWLEKRFSVRRNPGAETWLSYYLYSLERACRMTGRRFIGQHDWFREGVRALIKSQTLSGAWPEDVEFKPVHDQHVSTSFSLMFMAKGRWPVVVADLKRLPQDDWNRHRSAMFHLISYVEKVWQRNLTHQIVDVAAASVEDLLESPIVFLSGRDAPQFTAEEKQKLRMYLDRGGFLFAVRCCGGSAFDQGFRKLMEEIFPESDFQLRPLPAEHPAWYCEERIDPDHLPELWGVNAGCRTAVIYCPQDLSCYWELARPGRETRYSALVQKQIKAARSAGVNVISFATNREVRFKNPASILARDAKPAGATDRGLLSVANVVHPGGCHSAPAAVENLLRLAESRLTLRCDTQPREVRLTDPELFDYPLVFLRGRTSFAFTAAERQQLRAYLERGGTLFADAICSSKEFTASFRQEMQTIFPADPLAPIPPDHALFTTKFGGEDVTVVSRREPSATRDRARVKPRLQEGAPVLEGLKLANRLAVIFSPHDVSCALSGQESVECAGYIRKDAVKISLNVLFYALHQ